MHCISANLAPEISLLDSIEREIGHLQLDSDGYSDHKAPARVPFGPGQLLDLEQMPAVALARLKVASWTKDNAMRGKNAGIIMYRAWIARDKPISVPTRVFEELISLICNSTTNEIARIIREPDSEYIEWGDLIHKALSDSKILDEISLEDLALAVCANLSKQIFNLGSGHSTAFGSKSTYSYETQEFKPQTMSFLPEGGDIITFLVEDTLMRCVSENPDQIQRTLALHDKVSDAISEYCIPEKEIRSRIRIGTIFSYGGYPWQQRTKAEKDVIERAGYYATV